VTIPPQNDARAGGQGSPLGAGRSNLASRAASAAVLAPLALAAAYAGGWIFAIVCVAAAGIVLCEWTLLVFHHADGRVLVPGLAALLAAALLSGLNQPAVAAGSIAIGAVLAGLAVALAGQRSENAPTTMPAWAVGGVIYAGMALLGPALLRRDPQLGLTAMFFLAAIVWTTDVFAYFIGRAVGGPLLWPRVSPNKTWSGAVGGTAGGVAAGTLLAYASGLGGPEVGVVALVLSVLAQVGDLFESAVKRRFGAKDASHLIPGHGGVMDRLDGLLVAAIAALLIGIVRQGVAAPAQGLLIW
jgi:phosphatidate cytidylyltransferase